MKLNFIRILLITVIFTSCRGAKKIQTAIEKKDTVAAIIIKEDIVDSAVLKTNILKKIYTNKINFKYFSSKVKVDYQDQDGKKHDATANIRIKKDSLIWISLTGTLGIEGFRVLINKDSVIVMDKLQKTISKRSIDYLKDVTQLPFDFYTLQDFLIGNTIYFANNIVSYKNNGSNILALSIGQEFKHLLTFDSTDNRILHSKLDDLDASKSRTCDITFSDYEWKDGRLFSTKREVTVTEKSKLDIQLDYKQIKFDVLETFPFTVPKSYKVKK